MASRGRPKELMERITTSISTEKSVFEAFKKNIAREGSDVSSYLTEAMAEYNKKHGEGNPQPPMTKWMEDPNYRAYPTISMSTESKDNEAFTDEELMEIGKSASAWSKWAWGWLERRNATRKVEHRKIKETDIKWHMKSKKFTRQQAVSFLKQQGFEE